METRITQLIEKLCAEKHADAQHCEMNSPNVHVVHTPIPVELYRQLETISSEYDRDVNCLAGDLLTLALEEAIEHIPSEENIRLGAIRHMQDVQAAESQRRRFEFDAGGT